MTHTQPFVAPCNEGALNIPLMAARRFVRFPYPFAPALRSTAPEGRALVVLSISIAWWEGKPIASFRRLAQLDQQVADAGFNFDFARIGRVAQGSDLERVAARRHRAVELEFAFSVGRSPGEQSLFGDALGARRQQADERPGTQPSGRLVLDDAAYVQRQRRRDGGRHRSV